MPIKIISVAGVIAILAVFAGLVLVKVYQEHKIKIELGRVESDTLDVECNESIGTVKARSKGGKFIFSFSDTGNLASTVVNLNELIQTWPASKKMCIQKIDKNSVECGQIEG